MLSTHSKREDIELNTDDLAVVRSKVHAMLDDLFDAKPSHKFHYVSVVCGRKGNGDGNWTMSTCGFYKED